VSPGQGVPPLRRGPFWQKISEVVSFDISLVQVVSSVKNSVYLGWCGLIWPPAILRCMHHGAAVYLLLLYASKAGYLQYYRKD
jgi:hypothetical protein